MTPLLYHEDSLPPYFSPFKYIYIFLHLLVYVNIQFMCKILSIRFVAPGIYIKDVQTFFSLIATSFSLV